METFDECKTLSTHCSSVFKKVLNLKTQSSCHIVPENTKTQLKPLDVVMFSLCFLSPAVFPVPLATACSTTVILALVPSMNASKFRIRDAISFLFSLRGPRCSRKERSIWRLAVSRRPRCREKLTLLLVFPYARQATHVSHVSTRATN